MPLQQAVVGEIGGLDAEDWYRFEVPAGTVLNVTCRALASTGFLSCALHDREQREIWDSGDLSAGNLKRQRVVMSSTSGGIYFLKVARGPGRYEVSARVAAQNDALTGRDAADRLSKAEEIGGIGTVTGEIGGYDEEDWFRIRIPAGHILNLMVASDVDGRGIQVTVSDSASREVWHSGTVAAGASQALRLMMNNSSGGDYFIRVHGGSGSYRLESVLQSQNDAGSGGDAGDRMGSALPIADLRALGGELGGFDEQDWYAFSPREGSRIRFAVSAGASPMKLSFHNLERNEGWYAAEVAPGMSRTVQIPSQISPPYYLKVHGAHGRYTIETR
jgi:hypothetical protein